MQAFALSTILGLCCTMLGAFFLAVEAIGLDTIAGWNSKELARGPSGEASSPSVETPRRAAHRGARWFPPGMWVIAVGCGALLGAWLAHTMQSINPPWKPQWIPVGGIILGGVIGPLTLWSMRHMFKASTHYLRGLEQRTQKGTIGFIGFIVMCIGFLLQLVGTVPHFFN